MIFNAKKIAKVLTDMAEAIEDLELANKLEAEQEKVTKKEADSFSKFLVDEDKGTFDSDFGFWQAKINGVVNGLNDNTINLLRRMSAMESRGIPLDKSEEMESNIAEIGNLLEGLNRRFDVLLQRQSILDSRIPDLTGRMDALSDNSDAQLSRIQDLEAQIHRLELANPN